MPDLSSLLFGGGVGCPRDCSPRGLFVSSHLPAISVSAARTDALVVASWARSQLGKLRELRRPDAATALPRAGPPQLGATGDSVCEGATGGADWPLCASFPAVISGRSRSSARWMDPPCPTPEVDCWSGGVRVGRRRLSSGRAPAPARRSGRVISRRDPSDSQVNVMVDFMIPLPRRGAEAFIVSIVGPSYLIALLPLRLTISSYPSTMPLMLAVRRASAGKECRPYLC
ncbi:hypothetical protein BHM03_00034203 [Ensete ventricosum]|nr:hypothetical protein BHM03_00034203 [Ensete ventricosum]